MNLLNRIGRALYLRLDRRYGDMPRGSYTAVFDHTAGVLRLEPTSMHNTANARPQVTFSAVGSPNRLN